MEVPGSAVAPPAGGRPREGGLGALGTLPAPAARLPQLASPSAKTLRLREKGRAQDLFA